MSEKMKSLLSWFDVFDVYRKIREVESGKSGVNFVAGTRVTIIPSDVYRENLQFAMDSMQSEMKIMDENIALIYRNDELKEKVIALQKELENK
jgi:hypothetical protein